ncbi:MAG: prepilin-type N-terminal cleavage/methylation domain-containing protein [Armatimonadota bacterium]|nr:prepilin-type N-terminal cleavage/methylation domain-containing protein [bacterium]
MRGKRGFTLIELLVVIAIIAILAAILFPVFTSVKEKGRQTACLSNMMQLAKGFRMYLDDKNNTYPGTSPLNDANVPYDKYMVYVQSGWLYCYIQGSTRDIKIEKGGLFPYVKNKAVYICPSDVNAKKASGLGFSYSMNGYFRWLPESKVRNTAKTVLLVDEGKGSYSKYYRQIVPVNDGNFAADPDPNKGDRASEAHCGGGNFGWADGHCTWTNVKTFTKLNFVP